MKKSLLALAVLGAFAGTAMAQSSVTIYGKVDQAFSKDIGTKNKEIKDWGGSRLGFRGVEDLGGGLAALFNIEHRFDPDTGNTNTSTFWNGVSTVGLRSAWGTVNLGRQYTAAFSLAQNTIDPFAGDTVAALRNPGVRAGGFTTTRVANSVRYDFGAAGINFAASIGESDGVGVDRPFSAAANYSAGPLFAALGYEDQAGVNDKLWTLGGRYAFGPATLSAGFSTGKNNANTTVRGALVGVNYSIGGGDLKLGFAREKIGSTVTVQKVGLGYHYALSKRTKLYADIGHNNKVATEKTGYDFGIQHNF